MTILAFLSPATKLGQGNTFSSVCQEFCPQGGWVVVLVSRPRPRGDVGGVWPGGGGVGVPGPHPQGRLARGVSRPIPRGCWGVWLEGGCLGPYSGGVSRPTPGGGWLGPHLGGVQAQWVYPSMH